MIINGPSIYIYVVAVDELRSLNLFDISIAFLRLAPIKNTLHMKENEILSSVIK